METPPAATLCRILGREPSIHEVALALFDGVRSLEDPNAEPLDETEIRDATLRHLDHYRNELWTWRR
jgi:hypothetical protein